MRVEGSTLYLSDLPILVGDEPVFSSFDRGPLCHCRHVMPWHCWSLCELLSGDMWCRCPFCYDYIVGDCDERILTQRFSVNPCKRMRLMIGDGRSNEPALCNKLFLPEMYDSAHHPHRCKLHEGKDGWFCTSVDSRRIKANDQGT